MAKHGDNLGPSLGTLTRFTVVCTHQTYGHWLRALITRTRNFQRFICSKRYYIISRVYNLCEGTPQGFSLWGKGPCSSRWLPVSTITYRSRFCWKTIINMIIFDIIWMDEWSEVRANDFVNSRKPFILLRNILIGGPFVMRR